MSGWRPVRWWQEKHDMVSRRLVLSGLLGLAGSALFDIAIGAAATGEAALPEGTARALDQVDVAFSQRP